VLFSEQPAHCWFEDVLVTVHAQRCSTPRSTLALIIAMHLRSSFVSGLGLIASYSDAMPSAPPPPPALRVFGEVSVFVTS
jgi:hypothetical protein